MARSKIYPTFRNFIMAALLISTSASFSMAQDFGEGLEAYATGDYQAALQEWRPLAESGHALAQLFIGKMYRQGKGVVKHDLEAVYWYRKSAVQGNARAQLNLGLMYAKELGVNQDYLEAAVWYLKSANQGHHIAQFNLGQMYNQGRGVPQNYLASHMWFNIAGANGNEDAVEARDLAAGQLTPQQITQAQAMAKECLASDYKNCT